MANTDKLVKKILNRMFYSSNGNFELRYEQMFVNSQQSRSQWSSAENVERTTYLYSTTQNNNKFMANSNSFYVFEYRDQDYKNNKSVYLSYPHIPGLKRIMKSLCSELISPKTFSENNGEVDKNYSKPYVLSNIGPQNKWLSFRLYPISVGENIYQRGILIQIPSGQENKSAKCCYLTDDEFMNISDMICSTSMFQLNMTGMSMYASMCNVLQNPFSGSQDNSYSGGYSRNTSNNAPPPPFGDDDEYFPAPPPERGNSASQNSTQVPANDPILDSPQEPNNPVHNDLADDELLAPPDKEDLEGIF